MMRWRIIVQMDNASGSAAVLEAARILSQYCVDYTIKYAFWDEEERGLDRKRLLCGYC